MNPVIIFESNKANSLTQESGWHAQNTVDRELIEARMASTEALFAVDSVGAFEFTDAVRPGNIRRFLYSKGTVANCFVRGLAIWNYR